MPHIKLKRIYEPADSGDGFRVLVDRLWPRGLSKENAKLDLWAKNVAPTSGLRKDYHSGTYSWEVFVKDYQKELTDNPALDELVDTLKNKDTVTLLFGLKDTEHNHAVVLAEALDKAFNAM